MARDVAKKEAWQKDNTKMYGVRIQNKSGIPEALEIAKTSSGLTTNAFIIEAIREKLIRDGYLKPFDKTIAEISEE